MSALRAVIVDDEPLARRGLRLRLENSDKIELVAECSNGYEALHAVAEYRPDLMFLDIQMPGLSGFDVVRKMQGDTIPLVIFVTAFGQYALDAFDVHAIDYLLKPIDEERLTEAVIRAVEQQSFRFQREHKQQLLDLVANLTGESAVEIDQRLLGDETTPNAQWPEKLTIKDGQEVHILPVEDIDWVDAAGDYMCIHSDSLTHIMRVTMKQLEQVLNPTIFKRVHRSTIINVDRVKKIRAAGNGEHLLTLQCGAELKVSRTYRQVVIDICE
ncbi:MAG: LytTR family DNA-binding domain-containing protein [Pseudomonadota bacterium]